MFFSNRIDSNTSKRNHSPIHPSQKKSCNIFPFVLCPYRPREHREQITMSIFDELLGYLDVITRISHNAFSDLISEVFWRCDARRGEQTLSRDVGELCGHSTALVAHGDVFGFFKVNLSPKRKELRVKNEKRFFFFPIVKMNWVTVIGKIMKTQNGTQKEITHLFNSNINPIR